MQKCLNQDLKSKFPGKEAGWQCTGCLSCCHDTRQGTIRKEGSLGLWVEGRVCHSRDVTVAEHQVVGHIVPAARRQGDELCFLLI